MAETDLHRFLAKVQALQDFVLLMGERHELRAALSRCSSHHEVVNLARSQGFEIGRRWGDDAVSTTGDGDRCLLEGVCPAPGAEGIEELIHFPGGRLVRIHSCEAVSPDGFWYDQAEHEWVVLLQGSAVLQFADEDKPRRLCRGDSLLISARRRHRLVASDPFPGCVWLAVFWQAACED